MTTTGEDRTFTAHMRGLGAEKITLGGLDIASAIGGVDVYLRPHQPPEVVIRPVLGTTMDMVLSAAEDKRPRYVVAPDVGMLLEALGWTPPEAWEVIVARMSDLERVEQGMLEAQDHIQGLEAELGRTRLAHFSCGDRLVTLEQERDHHRNQEARLEGELAQALERVQTAEQERYATAVAHGKDVDALEDERRRVAKLDQELAQAQGRLQDLETDPTDTTGR